MSSHRVSMRLTSTPHPTPFPDSQALPPSYLEATVNPIITFQAPTVKRPVLLPPIGASRSLVTNLSTPKDPYAFLSTFDTVFVINNSGSIVSYSWREVKEVLCVITPIYTAYNNDGVNIYFLNIRNPAS
ncbi:hypothetical protein B0T25DRAFT_605611 [Lasiosphaeria hispida]|uniref:Uncharacterized protein n=1 Tax=Lasiosphaeria hispida TaxID=260671 RepID=A0AAJ0HNS0_9PEZI|nr:hypothetical protein B0T25DRAFT_605611 [Lasiosphaeria hispida]